MEESGAAARPRLFETVLFGGLSIGILDLLDASIFFPNYFGITVQRVWQGVAAGLLGGDAALAGGWNTASLGILLHFVVAFCIATVYLMLSRRIPILIKQPVISGIVYGIAAHFVMQFVVIPLSAIGWRSTPFDSGSFANSIIGHALLVGLPIALIASWSSRRAQFVQG